VELQELRYVLALAEELNFTRAAARCHVSQQALSRAIARVERRLGEPIAVRRPRGCVLTRAGERLAARARPLVAEADAMVATVREAGTGAADQLRVGIMLDGAGAATVPMLRAFRAAFPQVAVHVRRLHADRVVDGVIDGSVDVALLHGPVDDPRVAVVPLFTEPRIAAVSLASPHADAPQLTAADLVTEPARTRRPGVRADWEGFFTLVPQRDGEQPDRFGEPTACLEELLYAIGLDQVFLTMPAHLRHTYPAVLYGVRYVPVPDLPPVTFGIAHRRPATPVVAAFTALAQPAGIPRSGDESARAIAR
jgi:DNA-binding transcriptional LysR family regulator